MKKKRKGNNGNGFKKGHPKFGKGGFKKGNNFGKLYGFKKGHKPYTAGKKFKMVEIN